MSRLTAEEYIEHYGPEGQLLRFHNPKGLYPVNRYQSLWLAAAAHQEAVMHSAQVGRPLSSFRVWEPCCGGGPCAIVLKSAGAGYVMATDINADAIEACRENAALNNLALDRVQMQDWLGPAPDPEHRFDLIVCNPPCRPSEHCAADLTPAIRTAIDGGAEGTDFYLAFLQQGGHYLREDGLLVFVMVSTINFLQIEDALRRRFSHQWRLSYNSPVAHPFLRRDDPESARFEQLHHERRILAWDGGDGWNWRLSWVVVVKPNTYAKVNRLSRVEGRLFYRNHSYDLNHPAYLEALAHFERRPSVEPLRDRS